MKKEEKLTISSLLSWDDVIQLGSSIGSTSICLGKKYLYECIKESHEKYSIERDFIEYAIGDIEKVFPDLVLYSRKYDLRFRYEKNNDGKWCIKYSLPHVLISILRDNDILIKDAEYYQDLCTKFLLMDKETMILTAKLILNSQKMKINEFISNYEKSPFPSNKISKNDLLDFRKAIVERKKNLELVCDYYDREFPLEAFKHVNKDILLLFISSLMFSNKSIQKYVNGLINYAELVKIIPENELSSIVNFINNYILVTEYISEENNSSYECSFRYSQDGRRETISSTDAIELFKIFINMLIEDGKYDKMDGFYTSYEELLSSKASETWKKIQNTKLVESIKLNFEMIESGVSLDKSSSIKRLTRIDPTTSEKKQAKLKRAYDLLEEKFEYYPTKTPVVELHGINNFVGYFAQFYSNGTVVLDKYYKYSKDRRGNEVVLPADDEAIYIMNNREFADLCRYTKSELIEEIRFANPDVNRIIHKNTSKSKWTERVDRIINGPGYDELDLDFLDQLIKALSPANDKILKK